MPWSYPENLETIALPFLSYEQTDRQTHTYTYTYTALYIDEIFFVFVFLVSPLFSVVSTLLFVMFMHLSFYAICCLYVGV